MVEEDIEFTNPTVIGSYSSATGGIGLIHQAGFKLGQIGSTPPTQPGQGVERPGRRRSGHASQRLLDAGEFVRNGAPSGSNTAPGWLRATVSNNGSTHPSMASTNDASGTDWIVRNSLSIDPDQDRRASCLTRWTQMR